MKKEKLKEQSTEQLVSREKSYKTMIGVFIPIIFGLGYYLIRDYFREESLDMPLLIITICSIGGMVSLFPELKSIREELANRSGNSN